MTEDQQVDYLLEETLRGVVGGQLSTIRVALRETLLTMVKNRNWVETKTRALLSARRKIVERLIGERNAARKLVDQLESLLKEKSRELAWFESRLIPISKEDSSSPSARDGVRKLIQDREDLKKENAQLRTLLEEYTR